MQLSQRIILKVSVGIVSSPSASAALRFLEGAGGSINKTVVHHSGVLKRESVFDGGHQLLGRGEDYLHAAYHGGGVEVVYIVHPRAAEAEAQDAQAAQLHTVARLQLQGDGVAHQVEARLKLRGGGGGVARHQAAHGARVHAVFYDGRSIPLARIILLLKVLAFYKSEFCHNYKLFFCAETKKCLRIRSKMLALPFKNACASILKCLRFHFRRPLQGVSGGSAGY